MVRTSLATIISTAILSSLLVAAAPRTARAVELKVLSGSGVQPAMIELIPGFEQSSRHKVTFDYGTVGGMADRVQKGEAADVIIASGPQIDALEEQGKVIEGSQPTLRRPVPAYSCARALQGRT
jgi:molybdate transport system substrate-binding protein